LLFFRKDFSSGKALIPEKLFFRKDFSSGKAFIPEKLFFRKSFHSGEVPLKVPLERLFSNSPLRRGFASVV
jgi:hypothetical protein